MTANECVAKALRGMIVAADIKQDALLLEVRKLERGSGPGPVTKQEKKKSEKQPVEAPAK